MQQSRDDGDYGCTMKTAKYISGRDIVWIMGKMKNKSPGNLLPHIELE